MESPYKQELLFVQREQQQIPAQESLCTQALG